MVHPLSSHANFTRERAAHHLLPPGGDAGAEVRLGPGGEDDGVVGVDLGVRQSQGQRRRPADHLALVVVLGPVARALELVLRLVPGHDAAEVGAHGVQAVVLDGAVVLHDDVRGVTLEALGQGAVAGQVGLEPRPLLDLVAVGVLGRLARAAAARARGHEEVGEAAEQGGAGQAERAHQQQVHHVTLAHVRHVLGVHRARHSARALHSLGRHRGSLARGQPAGVGAELGRGAHGRGGGESESHCDCGNRRVEAV
mmetsp:Transcript_28493/g.70224  ORF Transcript_28493/g.70224 Transcript_28493/m.70224 type:complete len:254 (+) Transcript_28493:229-990(+)